MNELDFIELNSNLKDMVAELHNMRIAIEKVHVVIQKEFNKPLSEFIKEP